jgi:hypothetical protein
MSEANYQEVTYWKCKRLGCGVTTNDPAAHDREHAALPEDIAGLENKGSRTYGHITGMIFGPPGKEFPWRTKYDVALAEGFRSGLNNDRFEPEAVNPCDTEEEMKAWDRGYAHGTEARGGR